MSEKKFSVSFAAFCVMLVTICKSEYIMNAMSNSLELCISVIIPSLFPFMVLSSVFVGNLKNTLPFGADRIFKKIFGFSSYGTGAFVCGLLCGYPIGAKCASELYRSKKISKSEAETLIACANNSGPLFIIGAVGNGMLNSVKFGLLLYTIHIICAIVVAVCLKSKTKARPICPVNIVKHKNLTDSICESVGNIFNVCGFVMFFSVINTLINPIAVHLPQLIRKILFCMIEITNGVKIVASENNLITNKLYIIAFALGWSGISVHMQVKSLIAGLDLSMKKYYIGKTICALLSPLLIFAITDLDDTLFSVISPDVLSVTLLSVSFLGMIYALISQGKRKKRGNPLFFKN